MAFLIRHATEEDAEAVLGIIRAAFAEYEGVLAVRPSALDETLESTRRDIAEGRTLLVSSWSPEDAALDIVADREPFVGAVNAMLDTAAPVGTARYEPKEDHLYVGRVAVLPEWRGQGVGRALMEAVEAIAPQHGLTRVQLATRASMPSNLAFYGRLGYKVVRREPHTRGLDTVVWFEKSL